MDISWKTYQVPEAESTNDLARQFPAWTIVRCDEQRRGRGRFNRAWFGYDGGLWATYNVPLQAENAVDWGMLPLVAGVAVMKVLEDLGVEEARLRWPNDVLIGACKLAGILVERPAEEMACIGIGVNMHNSLEDLQGKTTDSPVRLADVVPSCPSVEEMMALLATEIAGAHIRFSQEGMKALMPDLERAWKVHLPVAIETDAAVYQGKFVGITENGSPVVCLSNGTLRSVPSHTVNRLREL